MAAAEITETYLNGLKSSELLLKLSWEDWLAIAPPYPNGNFTTQDATTRGAHVVLIPRYGHVGYAELHNEKIAYLWLWAYKSGYFEK